MSIIWPSGPFTDPLWVGGSGGEAGTECRWEREQNGQIIRGLEVWWNHDNWRGVQARYADGQVSKVYGASENTRSYWTLQPGELVTSATLWGNGRGTRFGRLRMTTTDPSNTLDIGKDTSGQTAYPAPVGSGVLVGFCCFHGSDIDAFGVVFLRGTITSISINVDEYQPDLHDTSKGISLTTLAHAKYGNDTPGAVEYDFSNSTKRSTSTTFSQIASEMYGGKISTEVSASAFGIGVKVGAEAVWQTTDTQQWQKTQSEETTLSWSLKGTVPPGKVVFCQALCNQGIGTTSYTSTVTIDLGGGTKTSYKEKGTFQNVRWADVTAKADEQDATSDTVDSVAVLPLDDK